MTPQQLRLLPSELLEQEVKTILMDHDMGVIAPMIDDILQRFDAMEQELHALRSIVRVNAKL